MTTESTSTEGGQSNNTYHYRVEVGQSISEAVIQSVASASERKPVPEGGTGGEDEYDALEPLYNSINPDALDTLLESMEDTEQPSGEVTFTYCGYRVAVANTGLVTVTER